jgi:hypothetical protein
MSVFLLLLGIVTTAAGMALVASGVTIRNGAFDTDLITPGTIAAIGGLLLVGIGLTVRELRRIERVLVARPTPRSARASELPVAAAPESAGSAARLLVPTKPTAGSHPQPASSGASTAPPLPEDAAIERLRATFTSMAQGEGEPVPEESDVSLIRTTQIRSSDDVIEVKNATSLNRAANGSSPARVIPRLDAKTRAPTPSEKPKRSGFSSVWPVGSRQNAPPSAQVAAPLSQRSHEPVNPGGAVRNSTPTVTAPATAVPVSILKSGVVEGLAYSLYSDGSIEAQLPQGTLRFSSITALRHHLESQP